MKYILANAGLRFRLQYSRRSRQGQLRPEHPDQFREWKNWRFRDDSIVVVVVVADDVEEGEDFRCSCDGSMTLRKMGILFSEIFIVCLEMRKQKEREMNRERKTARDIETERKKERKAVDKLNLVKLAYGGIRI